MAWTILVGAGLLEIVWAIALKQTGGFTRLWPSVIGVAAAIAALLDAFERAEEPACKHRLCGLGRHRRSRRRARWHRRARRERLAAPVGLPVGIVGLKLVDG
jgi:quaternary ammonium compound-resistance protein SugE